MQIFTFLTEKIKYLKKLYTKMTLNIAWVCFFGNYDCTPPKVLALILEI